MFCVRAWLVWVVGACVLDFGVNARLGLRGFLCFSWLLRVYCFSGGWYFRLGWGGLLFVIWFFLLG